MASLSGVFSIQEFTNAGALAAGYRLYTYQAGTTTHKAAYTDEAGTIPHTYTSDGLGGQYIALNSRGEVPGAFYLADGGYDLALKTPANVTVRTSRAIGTADDGGAVGIVTLASTTNATQGAGMVGFDSSLIYALGTVGRWLRDLALAAGSALVGWVQAGANAVVRTVSDKLREIVSVKDFGAVGDGTTDDTLAFQRAIASIPGGGRIYVPRGWYRITTTLRLHSGLCFYGDGCTNLTYGTPTNNERPSHIFIDSDTGVLFDQAMDVQLESVRFFDVSLGARLFPTTVARGTAVCFAFSGKYPVDSKHVHFERCQFANFGGYVMRVRDPVAPHISNPDWNLAPVWMSSCTFYYNGIGVEIEADNADIWTIVNTAFFMASGQVGVSLRRGGMILLQGCFGGGGTMVKTVGSIRDAITLIGCQFEAATAMLHVADTMATQQLYRPIKLISCVIESPIILGSACHLITEGCRWVDNLEVPVSGCRIESYGDSFLSSTAFNIAAGSEVRNFLNAGDQLPIGVRGQIINGQAVQRTSTAPGGSITGIVGDVSWNSAPSTGKPAGWVCTVTGTPGTWEPMGQSGMRVNAGSPAGVITPYFSGEELLNSTAGTLFKSKGVTNADWVQIG
jgi:hypothetical protein